MPRRRTRIPLSVHLNGRLVGVLRRQTSGAIDFQYDAEWLGWPHAIPVSLSLPLREDRYIGDPVIAVFENLLPDNDAIRRSLAERVGAEGTDAYSLLSAIGRDCVGALQFVPEGHDPGPVGEIAGTPVGDDDISAILADLQRTPLGVVPERDFRISIAGAQEKTALLHLNGQWHIPVGATATTHILKPEIGRLRNGLDLSLSVENEHLCMQLAAAFGLPCAATEMAQFAGRKALVVERFDRRWTGDDRLLRLPQEDCCQALSVPPGLKYEPDDGPGMRQILDLLAASDDPAGDRIAFVKAQIVFWLLGATDGHAKNFSIHLFPGGRFRLTPLYDVMSAQPNVDAGQIRWNEMKMAMAVGTNRHYVFRTILPRHFAQTAEAVGLGADAVDGIFDELRETVPDAIERTLVALPPDFPAELADSICVGVRTRLNLCTAEAENAAPAARDA